MLSTIIGTSLEYGGPTTRASGNETRIYSTDSQKSIPSSSGSKDFISLLSITLFGGKISFPMTSGAGNSAVPFLVTAVAVICVFDRLAPPPYSVTVPVTDTLSPTETP